MRILIVEDEQAHAEAIRRAFQKAGLKAEILVAGTLKEYREITTARPPDIALLDLNLPDGRAVEVLTSPAEAGLFPILIMTSFGNEEIAVEAMKSGALDYIVKSPEAFSEMPHLVERALRQWRSLQERKQADEALRVLLERYRQLVENANEAIVVVQDGRLKFVNFMACEMTGYSEEELASLPFVDLIHPDDRELVVSLYLQRLRGEVPVNRFAFRVLTKNEAIKWVEIGAALIEWEDQPATLNLLTDITERKQAEEERTRLLQEREQLSERLHLILDSTDQGIFGFDLDGNCTFVNRAAVEMLGYASSDLIGKKLHTLIHHSYPDGSPFPAEDCPNYMTLQTGQGCHRDDEVFWRRNGQAFPVEYSSYPLRQKGKIVGAVSTFMDITERKGAEGALRESEEKYRNLFENAVEGIFRTSPEGRFLIANPALARIYGYGSTEEMIESITDLASQFYAYPEERQAFTRAMEEEGEVKGYELQLKGKDGSVLWVSMNSRVVRDEAGKILYYEGLTEDITPRKKSEEKLRDTLESLRRALRTTIQVMVAAVEARDPYTAGHQKRVTDLARTLAQELGLAQETIEGIRMAGSIHDLGKISVPAEILSKPTKLTEIEFALIKAHSQYGYEILKDVESPWPLADMVLQHHERMDGSGYPQGLKGEAILLEARILAVADVVESISAHRPYRPGHGIETALKEIEQKAGVLYDREVVEACLRLFREKGFRFE
jgi:PAS domain S-box-containing protein